MIRTVRVAATRWLTTMVVCATALAAAPAAAQPAPSGSVSEGRGYLSIGWGTLDLAALNTSLTDRGYPSFPERRLTIGAGGHGIRGRWILGGEGHAFVGKTTDAIRTGQNYETALNGGYGFFNVGYLAMQRGHLHAYPFAGIGGAGAQLRIRESSAPTFDDVLRDPGRSASLTTGGLVLQFGIAVDQLFVLQSRESAAQSSQAGLVFGLRLGYAFMPAQSAWRQNSTRVASGPDVGIDGPYIRFVVGAGGRRSTN